MKRSIRSLLTMTALACVVLVSGCATNSTQTAADLQAQVAIACPALQATFAQVSVIAGSVAATSPIYAKLQADIAKAQPVVTAACAANAAIDASTITSLANTALPAISDLVGSLNLPTAKVQQLQTVLVTAEVALNIAGVVESQIAAAQAANSGATAPAASSSTH